jgi:hypothetical protein
VHPQKIIHLSARVSGVEKRQTADKSRKKDHKNARPSHRCIRIVSHRIFSL